MRRIILSMLVLALSVTTMVAQTGMDAFKQAKKSFDTYKLNGDVEALAEAASLIAASMDDSEVAGDPKALLEAGDIYKEVIIQYVQARVLDPQNTTRGVDLPATKAAKAYLKAYEATDKKGPKKAALKGLSEIMANITNEGIYYIQDGTKNESFYGKSYEAFSTNLMVADFLEANGGEVLADPATMMQDKYYGGLGAMLAGDMENAQPLFEELMEAGHKESGIYDGLFKIYSDKNMDDKAEMVLNKGRELFPEEPSLLFSEINFLLKQDRLDELTGKLDQAIAKEPDNMSLYATLAQVYENLYKQSTEAGDEEAALKYYEQAQREYNRGLEKDPSSARMIYGLGAMIYNRGAAMSQELVELGNDFSKEGQKKYEALKVEVDAEFAKALPFFQKAEMADPNDVNTLIALKEMYARQDEYEISGEFKTRIETIQGGGKVAKSYFAEKGM